MRLSIRLTHHPKTAKAISGVAQAYSISNTKAIQLIVAYELGLYSAKHRVKQFSNQSPPKVLFLEFSKGEHKRVQTLSKDREQCFANLARTAAHSFVEKMTSGKLDNASDAFKSYTNAQQLQQ